MPLPRAFDALLDRPVWVAWNDEGGRKVPKSPHGGNARSNDPATWGTHAEAEAERARRGYTGVGIMLTDGLVGVDLDHAYGGDGELLPWAREIVDELGCYTERSPSGTGVHILAYADIGEVGPIGRRGDGVEVYNNRRYFTVTGDAVEDRPIYDLTDEIAGFVARHFPGESPEERLRRAVGSMAADQAKRSANRTMRKNADRDGLRWARVPTGPETCGFCLMLASRGFVYGSERTAGALDHYHRGCDCAVVPGFDGLTGVEGYDPDALYDAYSDSYATLGGREGLRDAWGRLDASDRAARTARHGGDEGDAFEAFCEERISREIETRDPEWVRSGAKCRVTKMPGAKPRRKETDVAEVLTAHGFNVEFVRETKTSKVFDAYLNGVPYEFKVPEEYNGKTVKNQFKKAIGKGTSRLVISNLSNGADPDSMCSDIVSIIESDDFIEIDNVLFVGSGGVLRRFRR